MNITFKDMVNNTINEYNNTLDDIKATFDYYISEEDDLIYLRDNIDLSLKYIDDISFNINNTWLNWIEEETSTDNMYMYYDYNSNEVFQDIGLCIMLNMQLSDLIDNIEEFNSLGLDFSKIDNKGNLITENISKNERLNNLKYFKPLEFF